ncbi:hypothetical protein FHS21_001361 [Phyllobacterium trifolii]|uniref:Uncharacterized protein n=1 Tax=Phyllobacterium trifolii TaxID=300193 RepID=A0A839U7I0_9HYPH|nr:hypothetical protein [Phyllobacterium trifolii]
MTQQNLRADSSIGQSVRIISAAWSAEVTTGSLEEDMSSGAARFAFIQAAKEAENYVDKPEGRPPTGKLTRWHKSRPRRMA